MAYTQIKAGKSGVYGLGRVEAIAKNSFACQTGMFLKVLGVSTDNFVDAAGAGDSVIGVSDTENTFASDNQTVAQAKVNYVPLEANDTYIIKSTGQTIVFSADLVTSNTINLKVNGVSMTQKTFATDSTTTIAAIAAQLVTDFGSLLDAATGSGARTIIITPKGANSAFVVSNVVVAAGASQATATLAEVTPTYGDWAKYYDITSGQFINANSESTSTGTFLCVNALAQEYRIVNL